MKIAIVNKQDLSIASWYDAPAADQSMYGGPWGDSSQFAHVELASGDHRVMSAVLIPADEENEIEEHIELQVDAAKEAALAAQQMEQLRAERNNRLALCDWTQVADAPLSVEQKAAWAAYRQELRDLPENTEDAANPEWPSQPA
jgi:hypothetical protein